MTSSGRRPPGRRPTPPRRRSDRTQALAATTLAAVLSLVVPACSWFDDEAPGTAPLPPGTLAQPEDPGPPGSLLTADRLDPAPAGTLAWRIAYASRDSRGEPVAVTGQLIVPEGTPPARGWPLVSWAHPTTGTADACAPSIREPGVVHLAPELAQAGVAVVATDYEGLGTEGAHPYLMGHSEGRSVLDAARAAMAVDASGVATTSPVLLAGFSQGGHAALWAGQLWPAEADELDVRGVLAAAPVTDVAAFARRSEDWPEQFGVLVTIAHGARVAHPELDLADVLTPEGLARLHLLEEQCIGEVVVGFSDPVVELLASPPRLLADWAEVLDANAVGAAPVPVPVLVVQGGRDPIVDPALTRAAVDRLCRQGGTVEYREHPSADHAVLDPAEAVPWILDRFASTPATSTCDAP